MEPESRDPVRDGRALREMAQLANAPASTSSPPGPAPKKPNADHSGLVDLAALMAEQPNWLDDALARAKASAGTSLAPPSFASLAPASIAPTMTELGDDPSRGAPRSRSLPLILTSAGAGLLVAGACVFALRMNRPPAAPPPAQAVAVAHVEAPAVPPPAAVLPPAETAPAATTEPGAPVQAGVAQVTATADPAPPPVAAEPEAAPVAPVSKHGHHGRHEARATEARVAPVAAAPAAKEAEATPAPAPARPAPPPPHVGSALDAALRAAAGPAAAAPPPPAADPTPPPAAPRAAAPVADGRPERPSGSAVTSALTVVLPAARKCVAAMSDASRALVTFGSDGGVHKVDISGPAGSDPKATSCLRAAFGKAHVPPFSASSYAAGVTVRPQ